MHRSDPAPDLPETDPDPAFTTLLHSLLDDPSLSPAQVARKMCDFVASTTPPQPRHSAPNCPAAPHPTHAPAQNKPNFRAPTCAHAPLPVPTRPKTNPTSNPTPPRPLSPNQIRAIRLLRENQPTSVIAHLLHIDRHTLARWKRLPHFQAELTRQILAEPPLDFQPGFPQNHP